MTTSTVDQECLISDGARRADATTLAFEDLSGLGHCLADLYRRQQACQPDPYLADHATAKFIAHQVRVFSWYAEHLRSAGSVLDWGCRHAPDSCLARAALGRDVELYGCDFFDENRYEVFHSAADLKYRKLIDLIELPYADETFDVVISSGVLEHAVQDYESLKEIHRILRPGGKLVVTYIPNRMSYDECYRRLWSKNQFHRRLYGRLELSQMLKRTGFYPLVPVQYQSFMWEKRLEAILPRRAATAGAALLKSVLPVHVFTSTLCCVAEKVMAF
jgi:ubiquinone/menaquinone biosynthesis C-methylase UbiE